ncbi:MAG: hypothetical protein R6U89_10190 [Dehalococcoidia bacterium]
MSGDRDVLLFVVRFVCGVVVGGPVGAVIAAQIEDISDMQFAVVTIAFIIAFGLAAAVAGDKFWHWLSGFFKWWMPIL